MATSPRPSPTQHHRIPALLIGVLMVLAASCTTSVGTSKPSATTPSETLVDGREPSPTTTPAAKPIEWHECDDAPQPFECATLEVPVDHAEPDGDTLGLALVKLPATDQVDKIGPLLVNPGGPGGSGIGFVEGNLWPSALTRNFDIIGFDPRGVGQSSPIDCGDRIGEMYAVDPAPSTPAAVDALKEVSQAYVKGCAERNAEILPHMSTRDVARDLDDIRAALGVDKINYLGYSYGTSIGQVYADLFPERIRAMVLDGVVRLGQSGIDAAHDQGIAFDNVLKEFFAACPSLRVCPIGTNGPDVFASIRNRLRKEPMPTNDGDRKLTIGEFQLGVGQALYVKALWPTLAYALGQADKGDGTPLLQLADQYLGRNPDGSYANQTNVYFAVSCLDWDWPTDPDAFIKAGREVAKTSPYLAEGIITDYIRCAYWPTPPQPLEPPKAKGSPLIVVVSTTGDPATPYDNGVDLAKTLPKAALITKVGDEHTAYGRGSSCVDNAVNAYLISLKPPEDDLRCS